MSHMESTGCISKLCGSSAHPLSHEEVSILAPLLNGNKALQRFLVGNGMCGEADLGRSSRHLSVRVWENIPGGAERFNSFSCVENRQGVSCFERPLKLCGLPVEEELGPAFRFPKSTPWLSPMVKP